MTYDIVTAPNPHQLKVRVQDRLALGWEPLGAPFSNKDAEEWCQAVTKRGEQKNGDLQLREPKRK